MKSWEHAPDCLYVVTDGPAPCTCAAGYVDDFLFASLSTIPPRHGKMEVSPQTEATMTRRTTDAELDAMIDAGIKAVDLYKVANEDVISRSHLKQFLKAALAARRIEESK